MYRVDTGGTKDGYDMYFYPYCRKASTPRALANRQQQRAQEHTKAKACTFEFAGCFIDHFLLGEVDGSDGVTKSNKASLR